MSRGNSLYCRRLMKSIGMISQLEIDGTRMQRSGLRCNWTFGDGEKALEYFRVKNFEKYQTKKKFVNTKLHILMLDVDIAEDPKIYQMTAHEFAIWIRLLLCARKFDNQLPQDPRWLTARIGFPASHRRVDLTFLWDLGLLEPISEPRIGLDRIGKDWSEKNEGALKGAPSGPDAPPKTNKEFTEALKKIGVLK